MALDVAQQVAASARSGFIDVSLTASRTTIGKLTWKWDSDGDLGFDDSAGYAVLTSIYAVKGRYMADRTFGTLFSRVVKDKAATGSQLSAYARDGLAACEAAGICSGGTARADKIATGRWRVRLTWVAAGKRREQELTS